MNTLSTISNKIISLLEDDILVNTISFEKTTMIDLNKENIYPIANIDITNSNVGPNIITVSYMITILQQRDVIPNSDNSKIYNGNMIDNLNECHTIGARLINQLRRMVDDDNITVSELSDLTILKKYLANELDGIQFTISLQADNNISGC